MAAAERVSLRRVEACADQHKVGLVFAGDGTQQLIHNSFVLLISGARFRPRHIDVIASAVALAYPIVISLGSTGIEIAFLKTVDRKDQHCVVLPKHFLRAIAVVHIPIKN